MSDELADWLPDQRGRITSVICDRHPVFARGLARLLEDEAPDLQIAGVTVNMRDAQRLIRETLPSVGLIGLSVGAIADFEMVREICSASPATRIVLLVPTAEVRTASAALSGVQVSGFIVKERELSEIVEVVRLVARGHFVMPSEVERPQGNARPHLDSLKDIEREILLGIVIGQTNREIAARLHLSQRTVCRRLEDIYSKLEVADRLEAAVYAATHGLITTRDATTFHQQDKTI